MKQLELFPREINLEKELQEIKNELDKCRKALFSRQAEMLKICQKVSHDFEVIKMSICKGKLPI